MGRLKVTGEYPDNWPEIATRVKEEAHWTCVRCLTPHDPNPATGNLLTVHHFDGNKSNSLWWNLMPLCQRCHLRMHNVIPDQVFVMSEHTPWIHPYISGFYAHKYLRKFVSYEEVIVDLPYYLGIERRAVLGTPQFENGMSYRG